MAGIGYRIARTITLPIEELVEVAARVSGGDFRERARLKRNDEIGLLAASFTIKAFWSNIKRFVGKLLGRTPAPKDPDE